MWYAAHAILVARFKHARQETFPVWENIYAIWADNDDEAEKRAKEVALLAEGDSGGSFRWDGKLASWKLEGIRQITRTQVGEGAIRIEWLDGAEIAYNEYILEDQGSLERFVLGEQPRLYVARTKENKSERKARSRQK